MKLVNWLTRTLLAAAVMTSVSVATTWLMVNVYVKQLADQYGVGAVFQPVMMSDLLHEFAENGRTGTPLSGGPDPEDPGQSEERSTVEQETPPVNALPVMGQIGSSAGAIGEDWYLSMDDLNEAKESLTAEERMEIFSILISKVPASDVQTISTLLEGGLNAEELETAAGILQQHLSDDEYEKLQNLLLHSDE